MGPPGVNDKSHIPSIEMAINNEVREREFYLRCARETDNLLGRATFEVLANEELEHIEKLKELHQRLSAEGSWPETLPLTVNESNVEAVLEEFLDHYKEALVGDTSLLDAVRKAIETEAASAEFYLDLRERVENSAEKSFFKLLAAIEMEHCLSLKNTEAYLLDPEGWLEKMGR